MDPLVAAARWLLLVVSLPTGSATARMRIWRASKSLGCAALRDGAYLLPASDAGRQALGELAQACVSEAGTGWLVDVLPHSEREEAEFRRLFDRSADYAALRTTWKEAGRSLRSLDPAGAARLKRRLQREYDGLRAIDFFPGDASADAETAWALLVERLDAAASPGEPHPARGRPRRLDPARYRGRTWATRRRLWVDRVASAWLIRRFIDPDARFLWLQSPADCPADALGFDFDGATFAHVGERVTFETLLASFGLDPDPALVRLATMVHQLDIGGDPVPEASGFEAVMSGARERLPDDDALLAEMNRVLDSLYAHFARESAPGGAKERT